MKTVILLLIIAGVLVAGYIMNIIQLILCDFESPYKCEVIRIVGIFVPPVGSVTGYISIND